MTAFSSSEKMDWEQIFIKKVQNENNGVDPAHDFSHFERVTQIAKNICHQESGQWEVVVPAAWLHDLVSIPKNHTLRSQASRLSALAAIQFLRENQYPSDYLKSIQHAIESHSFSGGVEPETLEAKILQDSDRLDGLGAIGIARCFSVAGAMGSALYDRVDPFAHSRELNDLQFALDHFFQKLFKTIQTLHTASGKKEGEKRLAFMKNYLEQFKREIMAFEV